MNEDETTIQRVREKPDGRKRGRAFLTVLSGQSVGRVFRLSRAETTIGRGVNADVRISEDGVSRVHAKVVREPDGTAKIIDLNSTNGTYVNGRRVDVEALREGDRIRVGQSATLDFRYEYLVSDMPSEPAGGEAHAAGDPGGRTPDTEPEAEAEAGGSAAIKQRGYDNLAGALDSLGNVYSKNKHYDQAIEAYRRTLAIRERKFGPKHPAVAAILDTIGAALQEKGDHAEAVACHSRALAIYEGLRARKPPPEMAHVLVNLGQAHMASLEPRKALESLERARDLLEARAAAPAELARVRFALAQAYAKLGREGPEAVQLAELAKAGFADADDRTMRARVADVDAWLRDNPPR